MLPGARIIDCQRDPRDIGLSIFTFRFYEDHPYAHDLPDLGWMIGQQTRLMAHWRAVLGSRILSVRLDDWVADFDGTLARVLAHLDLPPDPACARFYERTARVRRRTKPPKQDTPVSATRAPMIPLLRQWDDPDLDPPQALIDASGDNPDIAAMAAAAHFRNE